MSNDQRQAWFARVMESGLENDIFAPSDVLAHATPDVLASFSIDNIFNQYYVQYMNAEGDSPPGPGRSPPYVFPGPGITFKGGLKIRFGA